MIKQQNQENHVNIAQGSGNFEVSGILQGHQNNKMWKILSISLLHWGIRCFFFFFFFFFFFLLMKFTGNENNEVDNE